MKYLMMLALMLFQAPNHERPDPALSPGATRATTTKKVCVKGSSKAVRNVPDSEKMAVYREYGMQKVHTGYCGKAGCEIDHIISLELGGSNDSTNLWPEPYFLVVNGEQVGAHTKDKLENELHRLMCLGKITMKQAQHEISTDWPASYQKHLGKLPKATP